MRIITSSVTFIYYNGKKTRLTNVDETAILDFKKKSTRLNGLITPDTILVKIMDSNGLYDIVVPIEQGEEFLDNSAYKCEELWINNV